MPLMSLWPFCQGGPFIVWAFCHCGRFVMWAICSVGLLSRGRFVVGLLSCGRFVVGLLSRGRFVCGPFVSTPFSPLHHKIKGDSDRAGQ